MIFINAFELAYLTKEIYFLIFIIKYKFIQSFDVYVFTRIFYHICKNSTIVTRYWHKLEL